MAYTSVTLQGRNKSIPFYYLIYVENLPMIIRQVECFLNSILLNSTQEGIHQY